MKEICTNSGKDCVNEAAARDVIALAEKIMQNGA